MYDGQPVVNDSAKADIFNNYFHSVFTQEDLSNIDTPSADFSPPIVYSYLHTLDVSKACGPDLISAFLLKCNESMRTGTLL